MNSTMTAVRSALSLLLLLAACVSCQALGAIAGKAAGPQSIPPKYVPNKVPTLVFAEHLPGANVDDVASQDVGRRVAVIWERQKISPVIDSGKIEQLRMDSNGSLATTTFSDLSINTIGRKLGAEQVVYIDVQNDQIEAPPASELIRGKMAARVRIIDMKDGSTLWPRDAAEGYPVFEQSDWVARGEGVNDSTVQESVRNALAEDVVRLFYKYYPPG